jgi:hypothetical protein
MRKKIIIILSVIIIGVIGYNYIYQDHRNIGSEKAEFVITSSDITSQFSNKLFESENKYLNKTIEISGIISEINKNDLTLDNSVFCQFSDITNQTYEVNSSIKIKGRCIGYDNLLEQVKLDQCLIISK